jgi:hypothetical protein
MRTEMTIGWINRGDGKGIQEIGEKEIKEQKCR